MVMARAQSTTQIVAPVVVEKGTPAINGDLSHLVSLCLKALAQRAPEGLAARDLVDQLVSMDGKIDLTPSWLSAKLNSAFKAFHPEGGTPAELESFPMTRQHSEDKPKRYIYRYVDVKKSDEAEHSSEAESTEAEAEAEPEPETKTAQEVEAEATQPEAPSDAQSVAPEAPSEASGETSTETSATKPAQPSTASKSHEPISPASPKHKLEEAEEPAHPRKKHKDVSRFNPYYDPLPTGFYPACLQAPPSPADEEDFMFTDTITIDEIDECC